MVAEPKRYRELQQPKDPAAGGAGSGTAENVRHTGGPPTSGVMVGAAAGGLAGENMLEAMAAALQLGAGVHGQGRAAGGGRSTPSAAGAGDRGLADSPLHGARFAALSSAGGRVKDQRFLRGAIETPTMSKPGLTPPACVPTSTQTFDTFRKSVAFLVGAPRRMSMSRTLTPHV